MSCSSGRVGVGYEETLVVSHVTLVMSSLVVTLGPVRMMGAGVIVMMYVLEVCLCVSYAFNKANMYLLS